MSSPLPESSLIRQEHIVRDMQLLSEVKLTKRGLVRYLALSLGLISPNESRTLMLDIFEALCGAHFAHEEPDINLLMDRINAVRPAEQPAQIKAVRYHLHQLKEKGILEKKGGHYKFVLPPMAEKPDLGDALEYVYLTNAKNALEKMKKALTTLEHMH
ncbi:Uncharacterised protein [uncultured archaeon]|nr:Uncharacterised protein [uncultured archaeon]